SGIECQTEAGAQVRASAVNQVFLAAPSAHDTKSHKAHEAHKVGVEYQRLLCWRQRLQSVEETHKSSSLCAFVSLVVFVMRAEGAIVLERRFVVSSCRR